jgi:chemotaxis protein histidine kinase CheA
VLRSTRLATSGFSVELGDDGRGIDFENLRAICRERGIPASSNTELIEAMFRDGVTTRSEANDISGRGVGLGAVVGACRAAGGYVEVDSTRGKGTWFRFAFPTQAIQVRDPAPSGTFQSGRPPASRRGDAVRKGA